MDNLRIQARRLRKRGLTYREIQDTLERQIPKSTLSYWCVDIRLTPDQLKRIRELEGKNLMIARQAAAKTQATRRERSLELAQQNAKGFVGKAGRRDAYIALAMLYLGEGYKYPSYKGLRLGSSDPSIVLLYIRLLAICFGKSPNELKCIVSHRADQDLEQLIAYWASLTTIPEANFYRSKPDPRTVGKPTKNSTYKGVLTISCPGVSQQRELEQLAKQFFVAVRATDEA